MQVHNFSKRDDFQNVFLTSVRCKVLSLPLYLTLNSTIIYSLPWPCFCDSKLTYQMYAYCASVFGNME